MMRDLIAAAALTLAAATASAAEMTFYQLPARSAPHDVAPAADGTVWFTGQLQGFLGRFDPGTGRLEKIPLGPGADSTIRPEPSLGRGDPSPFPFEVALESEVRPVDWKRTGIALGGFVLAACTLGGLAGWWSASGISEASPPAKAAPLAIPEARSVEPAPAPEITPVPVAPLVAEARRDLVPDDGSGEAVEPLAQVSSWESGPPRPHAGRSGSPT